MYKRAKFRNRDMSVSAAGVAVGMFCPQVE